MADVFNEAGDFNKNYQPDDFFGVLIKMAMDLCKMDFGDRTLEKVRWTFIEKELMTRVGHSVHNPPSCHLYPPP